MKEFALAEKDRYLGTWVLRGCPGNHTFEEERQKCRWDIVWVCVAANYTGKTEAVQIERFENRFKIKADFAANTSYLSLGMVLGAIKLRQEPRNKINGDLDFSDARIMRRMPMGCDRDPLQIGCGVPCPGRLCHFFTFCSEILGMPILQSKTLKKMRNDISEITFIHERSTAHKMLLQPPTPFPPLAAIVTGSRLRWSPTRSATHSSCIAPSRLGGCPYLLSFFLTIVDNIPSKWFTICAEISFKMHENAITLDKFDCCSQTCGEWTRIPCSPGTVFDATTLICAPAGIVQVAIWQIFLSRHPLKHFPWWKWKYTSKKYPIHFSATPPAAVLTDPFVSVPRRSKARAQAPLSACRTCAASPSMRPWRCPPQHRLSGSRYGWIPGSRTLGMMSYQF